MLIAVTCGIRETKTSSGMLDTNSLVTYFNELINEQGGTTLIIPPQEILDIESIGSKLDGLIITGGGDINPNLYKEENTDSKNIMDARDLTEIKLLNMAEENNIRTLAICRGHQMLNVYKGGTLIQDINIHINNPLNHTEINDKTFQYIHEIEIEEASKLFEILETKNLGVNSIHHQCVDRLGDDLLISARSSDGIVEAIETTSSWEAVGVQWHPEYLENDTESKKLFNWVVKGKTFNH